jgi:hypothetical protein
MTFESWTVWTFSIIHNKIYYTIFGGFYPKYNVLFQYAWWKMSKWYVILSSNILYLGAHGSAVG